MMKNENTIVVYIKVHLCWWCRSYSIKNTPYSYGTSISTGFNSFKKNMQKNNSQE